MTAPFTIERTYHAPIEKVWKAITDKDQMKEWYFSLEEFRPEVGFEFDFTAEGQKGEKYLHLCKITEVIPNKKLSYTWRYEGHTEETLVSWELFEEGDDTRLKLTHEGLEKLSKYGAAYALSSFEGGWTHFVGKALKNYVEKPVS